MQNHLDSDYYYKAADYYNCVGPVAQELTGISKDSFLKWYYKCCNHFYFTRIANSIIFGKRIGKVLSDERADNCNNEERIYPDFLDRRDALMLRVISRLYILRKVRANKTRIGTYYKGLSYNFNLSFEKRYKNAIDKKLAVSLIVKELSQEVQEYSHALQHMRSGGLLITIEKRFPFNPEKDKLYEPYNIAKISAKIELFQKWYTQFEQLIIPSFFSGDEELQELFCLKFTVRDCDELLNKVQIGPAYKPGPNYFKATLWALLDILSDEKYKLLNCNSITAASIIGKHYKCQMPSKPSKVRESDNYKTSRKRLEEAVKEAITAKKYGPQPVKTTP